MPFWNKRKLIDRDPKTIDLINLTILEKSLMAKLLLVNNELIKRYTKLIEASLGMPEMEQAA